jgi:Tol biopolymer transport system component
MHIKIHAFAFAILFTTSAAFAQQDTKKPITPVPVYADPAISPDGTEIAFSSGGDIWTVPATGGEAHLLISDPAFDSTPLYSPDGKYLAFNSTRTGNGDIYIFNLKTNELKRLTFDDGSEALSAWSPDGRYIYYSTTSHDISGMNDVYRVKTTGGTPMPVSSSRYMNEFFAAPSPDGKTIAMNARGIASSQWWRKGSSHIDQSEIWLMKEGDSQSYERITEGGAKELWPMWSKDGASVYYVSDRSGAQNLWVKTIKGTPKQLTNFSKGRVIWPTIANNGKTIVFERDFKIWKYDIATGKAIEVDIACHGISAGPGTDHQKFTAQFSGLQLSPDVKKVAFIAHGDIFVAAAKGGGDAYRVTETEGIESQLQWAQNSNTLFYVSNRANVSHLYQYSFITAKETRLTNSAEDDESPLLSPNGKMLAFIRNGKQLMTFNLDTREEKTVAKGYLTRAPFTMTGDVCWSPDGKWLAYGDHGIKNYFNVYVVPTEGGEPKQVSFLANTNGGDICWAPNGKYLMYVTGQRTEVAKAVRVDLVPQLPRFREDQFLQLFTEQNTSPSSPAMMTTPKPATEKMPNATADSAAVPRRAARGPVEAKIVTDGIRQRVNLLPFEQSVNAIKISKDGNTLLVSGSIGGQLNLYTYSLNELATEPATIRPLTAERPGFKNDAQFSDDGKEVYYLDQGKIASVSLDTKIERPLAVTAEMDVDFNKEKSTVFEQAWQALDKGYYDDTFHGANWNEVKAEYAPLAAGTTTPDELRRLLNLMVGELNSSHSGVSAPSGTPPTVGKLGLGFDRAVYENSGRYKITEVVPLGATDLAGNVHIGDYLTAIDDKPLNPTDDLDQLLQNKTNRKVTLTIGTAAGSVVKASVRPLSQATEKGLIYRAWVEQERAYVNKVSNGRLGYVHIADMSEQALNQLYLDLDAENQGKEGVVVDVRNNNGGFVNPYALDVLTRKPYLTMTDRGFPAAPARGKLGQRTLEKPTILVTNQHSLSDAEDFTEGYRTMGLGKVVGEPTAGWIIFTGAFTMVDGSTVRMPFSKITDHEGKDMELHPRPVDIAVSRQLGEGNDKDSQLDAAVKELLQQIGTKK